MNKQDVIDDAAISAQELAEFVAVARSFGEEVPGRLALELDIADGDAIGESWRGLCEIGFDRCILPERFGGTGLPAAALPAVIEEIAAGDGGAAMLTLLSNIALSLLPEERLAEIGEGERHVFVPAGGVRESSLRLLRLHIDPRRDHLGARTDQSTADPPAGVERARRHD